MFDSADPIVLFRMFERMTLTLAVIIVAIVVMVGFWRSVQKIDLTQGGSLGISGSFVFSTPVFALLTIVGYAYVSLSHPIKVEGQTLGGASAPQLASAEGASPGFLGMDRVAAEPAEDMEYARTIAQRRLRSLNCLAKGRSLSPRLEDDLRDVKLALMLPVWEPAWGDPEGMSAWVRGESTEAPSAAAVAFWSEEHVIC